MLNAAASFVPQPTILCPKCGTSVPLTEALAAPLIQATRAEFEQRLKQQNAAIDAERSKVHDRERAAQQNEQKLLDREAALRQQQGQLAQEVERKTQAAVATQLEQRLGAEKVQIAKDEERRAAQRYTERLAKGDREVQDLNERLGFLSGELKTAQQTQADLQRREREFQKLEQELPSRIDAEVAGKLDSVRAEAAQTATETLKLQLNDKDLHIQRLAKQLEDASRKAQQGSQQAQGESLELLLEDQLRQHFPYDDLRPVPKGEFGGDTLQIVRDSTGRECGRILWEFKRTKTWSVAWLGKLKSDQRSAKADLAVLVSQAMPPDVQHFNEVDGVWVSSLGCTLPVATALRASLLQLAIHRRAADGQQTKSELVYAYLTGPQFRGRIEAIAERWSEMQKDLADEKKATMKRWAKRDTQLHTLLDSTSGIWGDLQGIAGRDLAEIEALGDTLLLTSPE